VLYTVCKQHPPTLPSKMGGSFDCSSPPILTLVFWVLIISFTKEKTMKKSTRGFIVALLLTAVASTSLSVPAQAEPQRTPTNVPLPAAATPATAASPLEFVLIDGRGPRLS